jgi:hypothetical protein
MDGQHLTVTDLELLHRFGVVVKQLAIVVDVLRGRGDVALGLDRSAEGFDDGVGGYIEGEEVVVFSSLLVIDGEGDAPGVVSKFIELPSEGMTYMVAPLAKSCAWTGM